MRLRRIFLAGIAALLLVIGGASTSYATDVNNFVISNFEADYYLSRDDSRASTLHVEEKITAEFPPFDQNHGIERALPEVYDGHSLRLTIEGIVNSAGERLSYETRSENNNKVLRIGRSDKYVHGTQTYVIKYSYQNVTKNFTDHDEIFWDTNGTQWQQVFQHLTARVHIGKEIVNEFDGRVACYLGKEGSKEQCRGQEIVNSDGTKTITFTSSRPLGAGENLSFVLGFKKDTFAPYVMTPEERAWHTFLTIAGILWIITAILIPVIMTILLVRLWRRYGRSPKGRGTIVPEYLSPKEASVLLAAQVAKGSRHVITAQIIDFAVRHYIKVYEIEKGKIFKKKSFELEVTKAPHTLRSDERQLFTIIFGNDPTIGKKVKLDDIAHKKYREVTALNKRMRRQAETDGYFVTHKKPQTKYYIIGALLLIFGIITLVFPAAIMGIIALIVASQLRPRTNKGVALMEYIEGLKMYMQLAEAERLKVLQSPSGAEKVNVNDKKQLIKLYERVLPYAILLGVEKEWGEQFTRLSDQAPDWYSGSSPSFNAVLFAGSLSSFTNATASTFSSPSSSSSSGFSGGSSGGGGGGGGGGGW